MSDERHHDDFNEMDRSLTGAQRELESALRSLAPSATSRLDPVAAAFDAGRRDGAGRMRVWRGASLAAMVALCAVLLRSTPAIRNPESTINVQPIALAPRDEPLSDQSMLRLRDAVLDGGTAALPPGRPVGAHVLSARGIL